MSSKVLKWLVLLALLLLIVSFISFWFKGPSFGDKNVNLEITGPTQAKVGDEVTYTVKYANKTKLNLHDLKFSFFYPEDSVVIKDGELQNDLTERFNIDSLAANEEGEKEFRVFLTGEKGDTKNVKVNLAYKAGDLRSSFEKQATLATTIVSVPIALTLVSPPNVVPGQTVNYILDYRNETEETITDLLFEFTYPEDFVPKEFSPDPNEGRSKWRVKSLKKGSGGRISIEGILNGQEGDTKSIAVNLKRKVNDQYIDYQEASSFSVISNPLLSVDVSVNNSKNYTANPGDELSYSIDYKNTSSFNLSGLNLSVKLEGDMYDLSTLDTKGGFFDSSNKTIIWNASGVDKFSNFNSGDKGQIDFLIKLKSSYNLAGSNTLFVKSSAKLSTQNIPDDVGGNEVSASAGLVTNISIQPTLTQRAFYNDPSFGATGPLPPEVGKKTFFSIHWQVTNPGNDLKEAKITAQLPEGAVWENVFSSNINLGEPVFDKTSRELKWNLDTLPNGLGSTIPKYDLAFQVSVTPSDPDQNEVLGLLKDVKLSGIDSITSQNIIVRAADTLTDDLIDRPNEGTVK